MRRRSCATTAQRGYDESKALIARWHGRGRSLYAITPRFAGSSTPAQLDAAGTLWREHPDVLVQTHIAENRREVEWTAELFPQAKNYLDIYDQHGLIGRRAVLAHGIHLGEDELCRCHESGTALAHCPTSNLFLSARGFSGSVPRKIHAARYTLGSAPTLAAARVSRCSPPWVRPTRSRSLAGGR